MAKHGDSWETKQHICPTVKSNNENITPSFQSDLERLFIQLHDGYSYVFLHQCFKWDLKKDWSKNKMKKDLFLHK